MSKNNGTDDLIQAVSVRRLSAFLTVAVAAGSHNPHEFFKTSPGLWISDNFRNILYAVPNTTVSTEAATIGYADLTQPANDGEIGTKLPPDYVFSDVVTFLVFLEILILAQWGGKEGVLVNSGRANIFHVKVDGETFAVYVSWDAGSREWSCFALRLGDVRWHAGNRAFAATVPQD